MVRGILLTADDEVLLMRMALPWYPEPVWVTPGGGLEAGESAEEGLLRELREETGKERFAIGPEVWARTFTIEHAGIAVRAHERYFLVRCRRIEPRTEALEVLERSWFVAFRWWPVSELRSTSDLTSPENLAEIVSRHVGDPPS
jgi:ADP-ribose pyrophosphatase YjhB (NUDIX family)